MGFIRANMLPILREGKRKPFVGRLLLLGQGDMYFAHYQLVQMAEMVGVALDESVPLVDAKKPEFRTKGYVEAREVFLKLGFSQIDALDYSEFEGANVIHDLNSSDIPSNCEGLYDTIIDHGTLEHVFHLPNALFALFKFLKVGGRLITSSPGNGFFDHGFYMLQPTLLYDFYSANAWEINVVQVARVSQNQETDPVYFADYVPGAFDSVGYGQMGEGLFSVVAVATKLEKSTGDKIPYQGLYARMPGWLAQAK
ncbi:MAG: hypothetical protein CV089_01625 [Nitrospira sp. WS110]|nr:hypothetical protein [Nitrospira sp. WS110]